MKWAVFTAFFTAIATLVGVVLPTVQTWPLVGTTLNFVMWAPAAVFILAILGVFVGIPLFGPKREEVTEESDATEKLQSWLNRLAYVNDHYNLDIRLAERHNCTYPLPGEDNAAFNAWFQSLLLALPVYRDKEMPLLDELKSLFQKEGEPPITSVALLERLRGLDFSFEARDDQLNTLWALQQIRGIEGPTTGTFKLLYAVGSLPWFGRSLVQKLFANTYIKKGFDIGLGLGVAVMIAGICLKASIALSDFVSAPTLDRFVSALIGFCAMAFITSMILSKKNYYTTQSGERIP